MKTLFWTADSPFCRIVLWSLCQNRIETQVHLEHLSWHDVRTSGAAGQLGATATVPCLVTEDGTRLGDSLRIMSFLNPEHFSNWLLSHDGECHRVAEGQLSRILYALYDGVSNERLNELHAAWIRAMNALNKIISAPEEDRGVEKIPSVLPLSPAGSALAHILVHFCLYLKPEWRSDIPAQLQTQFRLLEKQKPFLWMKEQVEKQTYRVPCVGTAGVTVGTEPEN